RHWRVGRVVGLLSRDKKVTDCTKGNRPLISRPLSPDPSARGCARPGPNNDGPFTAAHHHAHCDLQRLLPLPGWSIARKHPWTWSLTTPTFCMNAYTLVGPTKR